MRFRLALVVLLFASTAFAEDNEDIKVSQEKVADSDIPFNVVEGVIAAPPAEIWKFIAKCGDYSKYMPRIVKSKELERTGDPNGDGTVKCEVTADLPFPLSDLTGITLATHTTEVGVKYSRTWNLISGDYHINQGSWTLRAIDGGKQTHVTYKLRVKPKINLPTSWMASAQKSAIKDVILRMRENVKTPLK